MDKLQWFKFTPTDWIMGKIQRCPEITQARFMRLICLYWNKECTLSYDDAEIEIDKEHLDILVGKKIIKVSEEFIIIEFLQEQFLEISISKKDQSKGGQLGNLKRWHPDLYRKVSDKSMTITEAYAIINLSGTDKEVITTQSGFIAEKIREDKIREEKTIKENKNDIFFNELLISESWLQSTAMQSNQKFKVDQVKDFLKKYNNMINVQFEIKQNKKEYCTHFVNWLNKQTKTTNANKMCY
jgi:hypothetical protein